MHDDSPDFGTITASSGIGPTRAAGRTDGPPDVVYPLVERHAGRSLGAWVLADGAVRTGALPAAATESTGVVLAVALGAPWRPHMGRISPYAVVWVFVAEVIL
jgi:hypothetical protein